jgi:hypothetical protein
MTKITVPVARPRNPFAAAARFRQAGAHGDDHRADRRDANRALKRELSQLDLPRDVRGKPPSL